jgi:hypothetical protein
VASRTSGCRWGRGTSRRSERRERPAYRRRRIRGTTRPPLPRSQRGTDAWTAASRVSFPMTPVSDPGRYHTSRLAGIEIDAGASDRRQARQASRVRRTLPRSGVCSLSDPAGSSAHAEGLWNESHKSRLAGTGARHARQVLGWTQRLNGLTLRDTRVRAAPRLHGDRADQRCEAAAERARSQPAAYDSRQAWLAASAASASARV